MSRKSMKQPIQEESDYEEESDIDQDIEDTSDIEDEPENPSEPNDAIDEIKNDSDDDCDDGDDEECVYTKKVAHRQRMIDNQEKRIVPSERRITSEYMTTYEYATAVGTRATHISNGAPIYVDASGLSEARDIAILEIRMKRCPLSIYREIDNNNVEIWEVNEMTPPQI